MGFSRRESGRSTPYRRAIGIWGGLAILLYLVLPPLPVIQLSDDDLVVAKSNDGCLLATVRRNPPNPTNIWDIERQVRSKTAISIWNTKTGRQVAQLGDETQEVVFYTVQFSSDGHLLIAVCDGQLRGWDSTSGVEQPMHVSGELNSVIYTDDDDLICVMLTDPNDRDATKRDYPYEGWADVVRPSSGEVQATIGPVEVYDDSVTTFGFDKASILISPDGRRCVTVGPQNNRPGEIVDVEYKVWDTTSGQQQLVLREPTRHHGWGLSSDGRTLVTLIRRQDEPTIEVHFWDLPQGRLKRSHTVNQNSLEYADLATGCQLELDEGLQLLRARNALTGAIYLTTADDRLRYLTGNGMEVVSSDGRLYASHENRRLVVKNLQTGTEVAELVSTNQEVNIYAEYKPLSFSPDGRMLAVERRARFWTYVRAWFGRLLTTGVAFELHEFRPREIKLFNTDSGNAYCGITTWGRSFFVTFLPDGRSIIAGPYVWATPPRPPWLYIVAIPLLLAATSWAITRHRRAAERG